MGSWTLTVDLDEIDGDPAIVKQFWISTVGGDAVSPAGGIAAGQTSFPLVDGVGTATLPSGYVLRYKDQEGRDLLLEPQDDGVSRSLLHFLTLAPGDFTATAEAKFNQVLAQLLGGTEGQVLAKVSDNDLDFAWVDAPKGGTVTPPTHVTAEAPTITDASGTGSDVIHLPDQVGVIWRINLDNHAAGDVPAAALAGYPNFTVTAVAAPGYALDGTTEWSFTFSTSGGGGGPVVDFLDNFTTDVDPVVSPRTPDTTGTDQWTVLANVAKVAGGKMLIHDPNGNGFAATATLDKGNLNHAVEAVYDTTAVPADGNAQYNDLTFMVAGSGNRTHKLVLTCTSGGLLSLTGTGTFVGALTLTPQNGANLTALPATGTARVAVSGPTITVSINGQAVATTPVQSGVTSPDQPTKVGLGVTCYTPGASTRVIALDSVKIEHAA